MCGIVGYTGSEQATPILLKGLGRLEYRALRRRGHCSDRSEPALCRCRKAKGRLSNLENRIKKSPVTGTTGIAHTRLGNPWRAFGCKLPSAFRRKV